MAKVATAVKKAVSAVEEAFENLKKKLGLVDEHDQNDAAEEEEEEEDAEEGEDEEGEDEDEEEGEDDEDGDDDEDADEDEDGDDEDEDEEEEKPKAKAKVKAKKDEDEDEEGEDEDEEEGEDEDEDGDDDEDADEDEDEEEEEGSDESDPLTVATEYAKGLEKKGDVTLDKATIASMFKTRMPEAALEGVDKKWSGAYSKARVLLKKGKPKAAFIAFTTMCVDDDGELHGWDEPYLKTAEGGKPTPFCSGLPMIVEKGDDGYVATDRVSESKYSIKVEKDEDGEISMTAEPIKAKAKAGKAKVKAKKEEAEEEAPAKKTKKVKGKIKVKKGKSKK